MKYQVEVGNDPKVRMIAAASAKKAAEKGVRQYRRERSFFSNECGCPEVIVNGVVFTPAAYATDEINVYDA